MAARLTVDFNSGSNGVTIAAGGSIAAVTGAPIYSTAAAVHGALGMGVTPATNASTFIRVDLGANPVSHSFSIYWHPKSQSASTTTLIRFADASNANIFSIVQSATKLLVVDSTSTAQATSSTTWGDQVYRIDGQVDLSTNTAPVVTLRLFAVPEGTVPTETLTPTLSNPSNLVFSRWLIGAVGTGGSGSTRAVLFDTFRVADGAEWLGPFQTTHVLTAAGTVTAGGSAGLSLRAALSASGSATSGGSAALTARQALTAAGSATADGSAALGVTHPLTAAGTASAGGSAALTQQLSLVAAGTAQADGNAELELEVGPVDHELTASGAGTAAGSAVLTAELSLQAAGIASAGGSASLSTSLALTAAGATTGSGHADLQLYSPITKRPAEGTTHRPASVIVPRPNAGITTRP